MGDRNPELQEIYHAFRPKILRYLRRWVGEIEAEDLTQEVFVKVHKALGEFRGEARVSIRHVPNLWGLDINPADAKGVFQNRLNSVIGQISVAFG